MNFLPVHDAMNACRIVLLVQVFLILCFAAAAGAETANQPSRIAILAETGGPELERDLGALLTAKLSQTPGLCEMVEREELDRIVAERSVSGSTEKDRPLALARLAKADGLISIGDAGAGRLSLRLISCATGVVSGAVVITGKKNDLSQGADHVAKVLARPIKLLASGRGARGTVVSLLGLRPVSASHRAMQTAFNISLAHELAGYPGMAVVERWKLDDVILERTLPSGEQPELATGSVLVDGAFEIKGDTLEIRMRVRKSENDSGETVAVSGSAGDQADSVSKAAAALAKHLGNSAASLPFDAKSEARQYAELAAWLIDHFLHAEAVQAAEAAIALGDSRADTLIDRMRAYGSIAIPRYDFISGYAPYNFGEAVRDWSPDEFARALSAGLRLSQYMAEMESAGWKPLQGSRHGQRDWNRWLGNATELNLVLLMEACRRQAGDRYDNSLTLLREISRSAMDRHLNTPGFSIAYDMAGFAYDTPNEGVAAFQRILATDKGGEKSPAHTLRYWIWGNAKRRPPGLPLVADWSDLDGDKAEKTWASYSEKLRRSGDLAKASDGLAIAYHMALTEEARTAVIEDYCCLLEAQPADLPRTAGNASFSAFGTHWVEDEPMVEKFAERFTLAMARFFNGSEWLDYVVADAMKHMLIFYPTERSGIVVSEPAAMKLLDAIEAYERRSAGDVRWKGVREDFPKPADLRTLILKLYPEIWKARAKQPEPVEGSVPLRVWVPGLGKAGGNTGSPELIRSEMIWNGKHLLGVLNSGKLMALDTARMSCRLMDIPPFSEFMPFGLASNGERVWYYTSEKMYVSDYEKEPGVWHALPGPVLGQENVAGWVPICFDGKCYAGSWYGKSKPPPTIQICELTDADPKWLVNGNRNPAVHPLDKRSIYRIFRGIYRGAGGKPVVVIDKDGFSPSIYAELETGRVVAEFRTGNMQRSGDYPLAWLFENVDMDLGGPLMHAVALSQDEAGPQLLFRAKRNVLAGEWATKRPVLDAEAAEFKGFVIAPIMHRGKFWLLKYEPTQDASPSARFLNNLRLVAADPKGGKPVVIPLSADFSAETVKVLGPTKVNLVNPLFNKAGLRATPDGFFITPLVYKKTLSPVLFQIRWSDLEDWLAKNRPEFMESPSH